MCILTVGKSLALLTNGVLDKLGKCDVKKCFKSDEKLPGILALMLLKE